MYARVWEKGAALLALFALLGPIHKDIDVVLMDRL